MSNVQAYLRAIRARGGTSAALAAEGQAMAQEEFGVHEPPPAEAPLPEEGDEIDDAPDLSEWDGLLG